MPANALTDALRDLWGPGLVFLALCGWLVRRALRAARNESILEDQRLRDALGQTGVSNSTSASSPTPTPTSTSTSPSPPHAPPTAARAPRPDPTQAAVPPRAASAPSA